LYPYCETRSSHITYRVIWEACDHVYHFSHGRAVPRHSSPLFAASTPPPSDKSLPLAPPVANHRRAHCRLHPSSSKPLMMNLPKILNSNLDSWVPLPPLTLIRQTAPPSTLIHRLAPPLCATACTTAAPPPPLSFAMVSSSSLSSLLHHGFGESDLTLAKSSTNPSGKGVIQFITDPIDQAVEFSVFFRGPHNFAC
jgi:hypothetical protein